MQIIVPLKPKSFEALKKNLESLDSRINIIEIWIDQIINEFMQNPRKAMEARSLLKKIQKETGIQFLAVCKSPLEKGSFIGTPDQKVMILNQFLRLGGNFVDLDIYQNPKNEISKIRSEKLWLSFHDFENANLLQIKNIHEDMKILNPYLYKFAITPKTEEELESFISWAQTFKDTRAIFTTMGKFGKIGRERLKDISWGNFLALDEDSKTANGQQTLDEFFEK